MAGRPGRHPANDRRRAPAHLAGMPNPSPHILSPSHAIGWSICLPQAAPLTASRTTTACAPLPFWGVPLRPLAIF
eukprot:1146847-Prymnesium_polylepis.1